MRIDTVNTKRQQLENGYFSIGNGSETILIIGSCRAVPYVQYFSDWNEVNGNRFRICFLDPFNWHFDLEDNRTDFEAVITALEKDQRILDLFASTDILIHEYYRNFGMFNMDKLAEKNAYQFGLNPKIDISIPPLNDVFILFGEIASFDSECRKMAIADYNVLGKLSPQTISHFKSVSERNIERFLRVASLSSIPEFGNWFLQTYQHERLFHSYNHISRAYTLQVLDMINEKFLNLDLSCIDRNHFDLYNNNVSRITQYDKDVLGIQWDEPTIDLKEKLF